MFHSVRACLAYWACAPVRLRRCAARMLRMSPLRGDRSVATPALPGRCAMRNQARPRSHAQACSGDCCSRALPATPAGASPALDPHFCMRYVLGLACPGPALLNAIRTGPRALNPHLSNRRPWNCTGLFAGRWCMETTNPEVWPLGLLASLIVAQAMTGISERRTR